LGRQVLRGNVESIFRWNENLRMELPDEAALEPISASAPLGPIPPAVAAEAISITNPVFGESEGLERLPDPPAGPFVRPVPEQLSAEDIRLQGSGDSGHEPPELEVIDDAGKPR